MTLRRLVAGLVVLAAFLGLAATASADALPANVFLCYSKLQTDPGVWSLAPGNPSGDVAASALVGLGYWKPFAEKSVPTNTTLPGGWFLDCNPTNATTQASPPVGVVGGAGEVSTNPTAVSQVGFYPMSP
jgi:hypothetical protein